MLCRPAERRTTARGIRIRVAAIMRTVSQIGTSGLLAIGVPGTFEGALMGTDSGCGVIVAGVWGIETRRSIVSPRPLMPPQQTATVVLGTLARAWMRSCN